MENATIARLGLTSTAFQEGQPIPVQFTCDGADQPPPLAWGEPPLGTKSFTLIVDDPDAPSGTFRHWGVYDMAAAARSIAEARPKAGEAFNDFGKLGYSGPCPPKGHGPHHYRFKLFAIDVEHLDVMSSDPMIPEVEASIGSHAIGRGELIGTYERK